MEKENMHHETKNEDLIKKILKEANLIKKACRGIDGELDEEFPLTIVRYCNCEDCYPDSKRLVYKAKLSHHLDEKTNEELAVFEVKGSYGIDKMWLYQISREIEIGKDMVSYELVYHVVGPGRYKSYSDYGTWDKREIKVDKNGIESKVCLESAMWTGKDEIWKYYIIENEPYNEWLSAGEKYNKKVDELKKKLPEDLYELLVSINESFKKGIKVKYDKPAYKRIKI